MATLKLTLVFCLLGAFAVSSGAELSSGCSALVSCMETAQEEASRCEAILEQFDEDELAAIVPEHKQAKFQCMSRVKSLLSGKVMLQQEKDAEFSECLQNAANDPELPNGQLRPRKQRKCDNALDRADNRRNRAQRGARQRRNRRHRRAADDSEGGSWQRWRELRQLKQEFRACKRDARQLKKACKPLTACCQHSQICHLRYELSETHDAIKQSQLDLILQRRQCGARNDDAVVSADQIVDNQLDD